MRAWVRLNMQMRCQHPRKHLLSAARKVIPASMSTPSATPITRSPLARNTPITSGEYSMRSERSNYCTRSSLKQMGQLGLVQSPRVGSTQRGRFRTGSQPLGNLNSTSCRPCRTLSSQSSPEGLSPRIKQPRTISSGRWNIQTRVRRAI